MFLNNLTPNDLGSFRILANESKAFKDYFNPALQSFIFPENEKLSKKEIQDRLEKIIPSNFLGSDKKKLKVLVKATLDYSEDLFNLGFIILSFRQEYHHYPEKFILNYDSKKDAVLWKEISNFINKELTPQHFTQGLNQWV